MAPKYVKERGCKKNFFADFLSLNFMKTFSNYTTHI